MMNPNNPFLQEEISCSRYSNNPFLAQGSYTDLGSVYQGELNEAPISQYSTSTVNWDGMARDNLINVLLAGGANQITSPFSPQPSPWGRLISPLGDPRPTLHQEDVRPIYQAPAGGSRSATRAFDGDYSAFVNYRNTDRTSQPDFTEKRPVGRLFEEHSLPLQRDIPTQQPQPVRYEDPLTKVRLRLEVSKEIPMFDGESDPVSWLEQASAKFKFSDIEIWNEQLMILESRLLPPMVAWCKTLDRRSKISFDAFEEALRIRCAGRESDLRLAEERIIYSPEMMTPDNYGQLVQKSVDVKYGYSANDSSNPHVIRVYVAEFIHGLPVAYYDAFQKTTPHSLSECVEILRRTRTQKAKRDLHEKAMTDEFKVFSLQANSTPPPTQASSTSYRGQAPPSTYQVHDSAYSNHYQPRHNRPSHYDRPQHPPHYHNSQQNRGYRPNFHRPNYTENQSLRGNNPPVCTYCLRLGHYERWCPDKAQGIPSHRPNLNRQGHQPSGADLVTADRTALQANQSQN